MNNAVELKKTKAELARERRIARYDRMREKIIAKEAARKPNVRGRVMHYSNGGRCIVAYPENREFSEFKLYVTAEVFEQHHVWIWEAIVQFANTGQVDLVNAPITYPPEYIVDGKSARGKFYCNNCDIGGARITHHRLCERTRSLQNLVMNPAKAPPKVWSWR